MTISSNIKYLKLVYTSRTQTTKEPDSEDGWDRGDTETSYEVRGVTLQEEDSYNAIPVEHINKGDTIYIVYAVYSTGDTFGTDSGGEIELVSVHKTKELAEKNVRMINSRTKKEANCSISIELDNGNIFTRYCPWDGYFESLDYCEYKEVVVNY